MELNKSNWVNLIEGFFSSKNIELTNYRCGIFDDENYQNAYNDTKKVAIITLDEPILSSDEDLNGAKRIKIHFDEFHFWVVTTHKFRNFKVYDNEWINFLKVNHPDTKKYKQTVNIYLFSKDVQIYEKQLKELTSDISNWKENIKKYEDKIQAIEQKIEDLANQYSVSVYKDGTTYKYKSK